MQGAMVVAWAHQDCLRLLDLSEQQAKKIRQLRGQLSELEKKLLAREEELKNNAIDLVARTEGMEKAQAKVGLLKGELGRLHEVSWLLKLQLEEAKATGLKRSLSPSPRRRWLHLGRLSMMRLTRRPWRLSRTLRLPHIQNGT